MGWSFLEGEDEFVEARRMVERVFAPGSAFPSVTCHITNPRIALMEFDTVLAGDFAGIVNRLAGHDWPTFLYSFDPDAQVHREVLDVYGVLRYDAPLSEASYWESLISSPSARGSEADAPRYVWDVLAMTGTAGEWGIWTERWWGVAAMYVSERVCDTDLLRALGDRTIALELAEALIARERGVDVVPSDLSEAFRRPIAEFLIQDTD